MLGRGEYAMKEDNVTITDQAMEGLQLRLEEAVKCSQLTQS